MALLNRHARIALGVAGTTALLATKDGATAADLSDRTPFPANGMHLGAVQLQSAGVMYFSRDGTLFVADPRGAAIYAIDVADTYRDTSRTGVQITDVDGKIAAALGTTRDQIRIVDMVAHPLSQSLYFSLTRGKGNDAVPALVRVTKADEKVTVLPLENIRNTLDAKYVMKGGKLYDAMSLDQIWPKAVPFGPYYWVNDDMLQQNTKSTTTFDKQPPTPPKKP